MASPITYNVNYHESGTNTGPGTDYDYTYHTTANNLHNNVVLHHHGTFMGQDYSYQQASVSNQHMPLNVVSVQNLDGDVTVYHYNAAADQVW